MSSRLHAAGSPGARPSAGLTRGVVVAGIAGFGALTAGLRRREVEALDRAIAARLQATSKPALDRVMRFVSWFGFPPQGRLLPPAYSAILWILRYRLEAVFQLAAWGTAPLGAVIKKLARRPRPAGRDDLRVAPGDLDAFSFPSGHVLTYVGVYGWMAIMATGIVRPRGLRRLAVAALTTLVAAIGPSRIYLGHHRPSDVAASYLLGSSYLAALAVAYRRLRRAR